MATRKPGFRDTTTNRNKRDNRYSNGGANNDTALRHGSTGNDTPTNPPADNANRNRFS